MSYFIVNSTPKSASMYAWHLLEEVFGLKTIGIGLRKRKFILDEQILNYWLLNADGCKRSGGTIASAPDGWTIAGVSGD